MKAKKSILHILKPARLRALLSFGIKGYLVDTGWFKAFDTRSPVDGNGMPVPWVTYSFIDFIKGRINKEHSVFEFGSGNSTVFYAQYASKVVSVEHDKDWFQKINTAVPSNAELIYSKLEYGGDYCNTPLNSGQKFHVIIVDGRDRINCCKKSVEALTEDGVIILDDSERRQYGEAILFLEEKGFKHLSFSGISPGYFYRKSTSVFYKADNCLKI